MARLAQGNAGRTLVLNADAIDGLRRVLLLNAWLLLVVGSGCLLRVGPRFLWITCFLSFTVIAGASLWKTEGVGGFTGNSRTDRVTMALGVILAVAESITGAWLWRSSRIWRGQPPPIEVENRSLRRTRMIWSGGTLAASLLYALIILVILPRYFPNLDPKGARRLEYQRQHEAWMRTHGHSDAGGVAPASASRALPAFLPRKETRNRGEMREMRDSHRYWCPADPRRAGSPGLTIRSA